MSESSYDFISNMWFVIVLWNIIDLVVKFILKIVEDNFKIFISDIFFLG